MNTIITKFTSKIDSCRLRLANLLIVVVLSTHLWALNTNSYNNISNEESFQAILDEIGALESETPIELKIANSGITLSKRILVRKNCNVIISGGTISVKSGYSESSIFYITNAYLTFKNITFDFANAKLLQTCFSVMTHGNLTIGESVVYKNTDINIVKNTYSSAFYNISGGSLRIQSGQLPKLNGYVIYNSTGTSTEYGSVSLYGNNFFQQGRIYNSTDCVIQLEGKLQNELTLEGSWLGYTLHKPFIISGSYQITPSDFNLMNFNRLTPESTGRMAYFDSDTHCVKLKLYEGNMTVDDLQTRLDENAKKKLSRMNFETIYLPEEGVLVNKPLYVRNGCQAMLKGGPLRISPNIGAHYCVMIDNNSFLYLGGITVDMMDNDFHINSGIFYNQGELRIGNPVYEWDVLFTNVPSSRGNYGESLFYIGAGATLYYDNPGLLKTGDVSIIKAGDMAEVNIWDGELESAGVPTIDGNGRISLGATVNGSNPDGSIINAKEYWSIESKETIKDLSGASTYISANKLYFSFPGNAIFEGNGKNIIIGEYGSICGNTPIPVLYLEKNAYITMLGSQMKVEWSLDAVWGDFTLEKIVVENVLSQDDFEKMTFLNMPDDREAYYDEQTKTVKLRNKATVLPTTGCDEEWLQKKLDEIAAQKPAEPVELTICPDGLTLTKSILVNWDCKAIITGGPITSAESIEYRYGGEGLFMVYGELGFKDINLNLANDSKNEHCTGYFWLGNGKLQLGKGTSVVTTNGTVVGGWGDLEVTNAVIQAGGEELVISDQINAAITEYVFLVGQKTYCNGKLSVDMKTDANTGNVMFPVFRVGQVNVSTTLDLWAPKNMLRQLYLHKDATINTYTDGFVDLQLTGEWEQMTLGRAFITSPSITLEDYSRMTFSGMPTNRRAEFAANSHQVRLMSASQLNIQTLLAVLNNSSAASSVTLNLSPEAVTVVNQSSTVNHKDVTFDGLQSGSGSRGRLHFADGQTLTITPGSCLTLKNIDVTGEGTNNGFIVNGNIVVGENVHVSDLPCLLHVGSNGRVVLSAQPVSVITMEFIGGIADGQIIVVGTDDYRLQAADLEYIQVNGCELLLDQTNNRIIAINATGIESIATDTEAKDGAGEYYDLSGRRAASPRQGTYILRKGGKTRKIFIK